MDELIAEFVTEAGEHLDQIDSDIMRFEANPHDQTIINNLFRLLHTIKGACGFLGLTRLERLAHAGEAVLQGFRQNPAGVDAEGIEAILATIDLIKTILAALGETGMEPTGDDAVILARLDAATSGPQTAAAGEAPQQNRVVPADIAPVEDTPPIADASNVTAPVSDAAPASTVRVDVAVLESMMTLVSELVLSRNQLLRLHGLDEREPFSAPLHRLTAITTELQDCVMQTRMRPIGAAWKSLPRIVRDLSRELGKSAELVMQGGSTELDRQLLDAVRDPIMHMVRNALDHGLETPQERQAAGKPPVGLIHLSAAQEGGWIVVRLSDDGRGLDGAHIRERAVARGLITAAQAAALSQAQTFNLIFEPGFSTRTEVTEVSGRGVGMDVVRTNIEQAGGQVELASRRGAGSVITLRIPLTLAIMPTLLVRTGDMRFAIPQSAVSELIRLTDADHSRIDQVGDHRLFRLRNDLIPLIDLNQILNLTEQGDGTRYVLVIELGARRFAVTVDQVLDTEEIVVKPLARQLRDRPEYAGATILGDGSVVLILEPAHLAALAGEQPLVVTAAAALTGGADSGEPVQSVVYLMVRGAHLNVAPMSKVRRLERMPVDAITRGAGGLVIRYRDRLIPVVTPHGTALQPDGDQSLVMLGEGDHCVALAVDRIVDMGDAALNLHTPSTTPELLGSTLIEGRPMDILNLDHFLELGVRAQTGRSLLDAEHAA